MSFYNFPNGQSLGGKYRPNFGGYGPSLFCWKKWFNNSGLTVFVPENSQAERISVNNGLQSAPGLSRILGRFGRADGILIVSSTPINTYPFCISPRGAGIPGAPAGCAGGLIDVYGAMGGSITCSEVATSNANPYYNSNIGGCFVYSSGNSETSGGSWNNFLCGAPFNMSFNIRYCSEPAANRGNCWEQCT